MKQDAERLLLEAFEKARIKGRHDWQQMTLAELKNRLLQATNRKFCEKDYGSNSFKEFVEKYSHIISLDLKSATPTAVLQTQHKEVMEKSSNESFQPKSASEKVKSRGSLQEQIDHYISTGDHFAVGELFVQKLESEPEENVTQSLAIVIDKWASASGAGFEINSISQLINQTHNYVEENLALAVVHFASRLKKIGRNIPQELNDLTYRIIPSICQIFEVSQKEQITNILASAVARLDKHSHELLNTIEAFKRTTTVTAKQASIDVIKQTHRYSKYALPAERALLRELENLLGTAFRKFCESCERHQAQQVPRRASELRKHIERFQSSFNDDYPAFFWRCFLSSVIGHTITLIEEGLRTTDELTAPSIKLLSNTIKLDLSVEFQTTYFPLRIKNDGQGTAYGVEFGITSDQLPIQVELTEPSEPFDLLSGSERLVKISLTIEKVTDTLNIPIRWTASNANGKTCSFDHNLSIEQQHSQPDWDRLLADPPYTINPIRNRNNLFGRDTIISELEIKVAAGTSNFLWGQKRVGKTSVLQVLASELSRKANVVCIVLRMGQLTAMHEGQIAYTIATRIADSVKLPIDAPTEEEFGAGMGRLIPFVENVIELDPTRKLLIIIDEFDDLDPAFYTGERGKQFVKALRSLSEVGLIFFFVGSERMDAIYRSHASDLNKWINTTLNSLHSEADCAELITKPVSGVIEYQPEAVKRIIQYCGGNPFYMHLLCSAIFTRCLQEHRTYVGESDVDDVRQELLKTLGRTNFAHFWEDNPEILLTEKRQLAAKNCLFLTCVASLGGAYDSLDEILEAQQRLNLPVASQLSRADHRGIQELLTRRGVIQRRSDPESGFKVALPIFRDWLISHADSELLPNWCSYIEAQSSARKDRASETILVHDYQTFPISEDDLLPISEKLVYLGKQKDVAEVRKWLRQFDDDNRIEVAFTLLKRLAERGFINAGANINYLAHLQDAINAHRQVVGKKAWKIIKRRLDNLCVTFVDSEVKSGSIVARELAKRMMAVKCGQVTQLGPWIKGHKDSDPIIVITDDFSGTGKTLINNIKNLWELDLKMISNMAKEGRIICCLQSAFPEAVSDLKSAYPDLKIVVAHSFGEEVRAFDASAEIFESDSELQFARDVLLQIGRQLTPQMPLGFGDMAALVAFHNTVPNNTLPIFWSTGTVNEKPWHPLFPRSTFK